jgi:broad specificity phosphatase PhoE
MRLFLVRHAEPEPLSDACLDWERPLSALGRAQAERLVAALAREKLDAIISSTMTRAVETAEPLARALGLPVQQDPALVEIDLGLLAPWGPRERERWVEVAGCWSNGDLSACCPGGESLSGVMHRVEPFVHELVAAPAHRAIAIVAHAVVNSVVMWTLCPDLHPTIGQNLGLSHAGVWELEGGGQNFRVARWNDTAHLVVV